MMYVRACASDGDVAQNCAIRPYGSNYYPVSYNKVVFATSLIIHVFYNL